MPPVGHQGKQFIVEEEEMQLRRFIVWFVVHAIKISQNISKHNVMF